MLDRKTYNQEYYKKNRKYLLQNAKIYYQENKNGIKKIYYENNKEKLNEYSRKYNKCLHFKNYLKEYKQEKFEDDKLFKILIRLRTRVYLALTQAHTRKCFKTEKLLGCSLEFYKKYIEAQFDDEMSWLNYGDWHIDHIKPCSSFDLTKIEEQQKCFHYFNTRPLWKEENYRKNSFST